MPPEPTSPLGADPFQKAMRAVDKEKNAVASVEVTLPPIPADAVIQSKPPVTTSNSSGPTNSGSIEETNGLITLILRSKDGLVKAGMPRELAEPISQLLREVFDPSNSALLQEKDLLERLLATSKAMHLLVAEREKHNMILGQNTLTREDLAQLGATYFYTSVACHDIILASDLILQQSNGSRAGVDPADLLNKFLGAYKELMTEPGAPLRTLLAHEFDDTNKTGTTAFLAGMLVPLFYISHLVPEKEVPSGGVLGWFSKKAGPSRTKEQVPEHLKDLKVLDALIPRDVLLLQEILDTNENSKKLAVAPAATTAVLPPVPPDPVSDVAKRPTRNPMGPLKGAKPAPTLPSTSSPDPFETATPFGPALALTEPSVKPIPTAPPTLKLSGALAAPASTAQAPVTGTELKKPMGFVPPIAATGPALVIPAPLSAKGPLTPPVPLVHTPNPALTGATPLPLKLDGVTEAAETPKKPSPAIKLPGGSEKSVLAPGSAGPVLKLREDAKHNGAGGEEPTKKA